MKTKIFTLSCLMFAAFGFGQNYWSKVNTLPKTDLTARDSKPKEFSVYKVDVEKIKNELAAAPARFSNKEGRLITFPDANGKFRSYLVEEASVMEAPLQAKYPELRSYVGYEKGNAHNSIRFSITPDQGISAMYFDGWEVSYLDSYTKDNANYIVYKRADMPVNNHLFECKVEGENVEQEAGVGNKAPLVADGKFRTYRLALAATGEYTAFHGGTVPKALAAMVVAMTRVNGIYEKTFSLTMVLVANTDLVIYTDALTDPYTNNDGAVMLGENKTNLNNVIGINGYDVGHVFSTGGGGVASLGGICGSNKARGVTGLPSPVNDAFYIDFVAHEMGHQFGANHTFNATTGNCGGGNKNNTTAFEPGSGSTIMAYAGICGSANNVQNNSDPYFHSASVNEIYKIISRVTDCSVKTDNNNAIPTADAGDSYTIPKGTAFVLTGVGTDADNDPLTYLWEQLDNQASTQPPVTTATGGPIYRSFLPSTSPKRYFPMLSSVVQNNLIPKWEVTPSVARALNFSLIVNDNKPTGNQSARALVEITVADSGPFVVTSQTTNVEYSAQNPIAVTWDVAGTDAGEVSTSSVSILLSKDSGANFDVVLSESVPNNGTAIVNLPNEDIASARIMVKAVNNVYFAVNKSNFKIKKYLATVDGKLKTASIYPNPAKNEVNISMAKSEGAKFMIYDASGRLVNSGTVSANGKINVEKIANGNYVLSILLKNGEKVTEKLMIKK